jgi:hypothetical protein
MIWDSLVEAWPGFWIINPQIGGVIGIGRFMFWVFLVCFCYLPLYFLNLRLYFTYL